MTDIFEDKPIVAEIGEFNVRAALGREYLFHGSNRIAECIGGDHVKTHGSLRGWLNHVHNRSLKRLKKIDEQVSGLEAEKSRLNILTGALGRLDG